MGKPRLIIIVRHAQSQGNEDKTIHQNTPDHRVGLTDEGHSQAKAAGEKLRSLLREDDSLHFFISPYKRTRQTTEGILSTLCSNEPAPSPFQRHKIKVYEEPRLREQDFGNFQPKTQEVERLWKERADYGHFFYRIPNGESGADVYDRVSSFNGSLWRRFNEDQMASVAVLVTHGLCSRVFLMAWYHYSVEFFEDLRNINHCEFLVMKLMPNGRYVLQNQLRRWSDLKRERARRQSQANGHGAASSPPNHIPVHRWRELNEAGEQRNMIGLPSTGQAPAPQTPGSHRQPQRQNTADLFRDDSHTQAEQKQSSQTRLEQENPPQPRMNGTEMSATRTENGTDDNAAQDNAEQTSKQNDLDRTRSLLTTNLQKLNLKSPDHTHNRSNRQTRNLYREGSHLGRDGGGSRSGAASPFELSDEEYFGPNDHRRNDAQDPHSSNNGTKADDANRTEQQTKPIPISPPIQSRPTKAMAQALRGDLDTSNTKLDGTPKLSSQSKTDMQAESDQQLERMMSIASADEILADALGDRSEPDVERDDEEFGINRATRTEMARIVEGERRERQEQGGR